MNKINWSGNEQTGWWVGDRKPLKIYGWLMQEGGKSEITY